MREEILLFEKIKQAISDITNEPTLKRTSEKRRKEIKENGNFTREEVFAYFMGIDVCAFSDPERCLKYKADCSKCLASYINQMDEYMVEDLEIPVIVKEENCTLKSTSLERREEIKENGNFTREEILHYFKCLDLCISSNKNRCRRFNCKCDLCLIDYLNMKDEYSIDDLEIEGSKVKVKK